MSDSSNTFGEIADLLQKGKAKEIVIAVDKALSEGTAASAAEVCRAYFN
jgi:hypothetical protein